MSIEAGPGAAARIADAQPPNDLHLVRQFRRELREQQIGLLLGDRQEDAAGVLGEAVTGSGNTYGVFGKSGSTSGKPAGVDFYASTMKVDIALLHEGDLINFLADLTSIKSSYVSVQRCQTTRVDRGTQSTSVQPRLRSECQIDLIVLRESRPV